MVADMEGDRLAAERARTMATLLLEHHKRTGLRPRRFQTLEEATRN
jgi:hypothetical protein